MVKYPEALTDSMRADSEAIRQDAGLTLKERRIKLKAIEFEEAAVYNEYISAFDADVKGKKAARLIRSF
jgi:hypothetical protein